MTIHIGDPGYLMSMLPGLYVACAALLAPIAASAPRAAVAFVALLVAINVGVFVAADTPFSARAIARHDSSLDQRVAFIRSKFPPASTAILAQSEYLTARYYLPEYRVLFFGDHPEVLSQAVREVRITSPSHARHLRHARHRLDAESSCHRTQAIRSSGAMSKVLPRSSRTTSSRARRALQRGR